MSVGSAIMEPITKGKTVNTVYCDLYEICGTATIINVEDLEFYNDGWICAECFDQMEADFFALVGWE